MEIRFDLPVNEGSAPSSPRQFFNRDRPIEVGSLEREAFSELGEWYFLDKTTFDIAIKMGIKYNFIRFTKESANLIILFGAYLSKVNGSLNEDMIKEGDKTLKDMLNAIIIDASYRYGNVIGVVKNPPQYMLDELRGI